MISLKKNTVFSLIRFVGTRNALLVGKKAST